MESQAVEFIALLSLVTGGGIWPPAAPGPPDAAALELRILAVPKGTPKERVIDRLGLTGCVPNMIVGTTMSHIVTYPVGRTHTLSLHFGRGKDVWEFYDASLREDRIDWLLPWERSPKP